MRHGVWASLLAIAILAGVRSWTIHHVQTHHRHLPHASQTHHHESETHHAHDHATQTSDSASSDQQASGQDLQNMHSHSHGEDHSESDHLLTEGTAFKTEVGDLPIVMPEQGIVVTVTTVSQPAPTNDRPPDQAGPSPSSSRAPPKNPIG